MALTLDLKRIEAKPEAGAKRWIVAGEGVGLIIVEVEKGGGPAPHKHPEEQISYIIEGKLEVTLGENEEKIILTDGMIIAYPPNVLHAVKILEKSRIVEVMHPMRKDVPAGMVVHHLVA